MIFVSLCLCGSFPSHLHIQNYFLKRPQATGFLLLLSNNLYQLFIFMVITKLSGCKYEESKTVSVYINIDEPGTIRRGEAAHTIYTGRR